MSISNHTHLSPAPLPYATDGKRRRWRRFRRFTALLLLAALLFGTWFRGPAIRGKIEFLYWQRECARYVADPKMPLFVEDPVLAKKLLAGHRDYSTWHRDYSTWPGRPDLTAKAGLRPHCQQVLSAEFPQLVRLDDWYPTVFLHERVSPGGTRRILMVDFGANIDHSQFCSLHCVAFTPATLFHPATIDLYAGNDWVPGWWEWGIRKDKLRFAEADPEDASHFVFRYEHNATPTTGPTAEPRDSPFYEWVHETDNKAFVVDGWLRDNGKVDFQLRGEPQ